MLEKNFCRLSECTTYVDESKPKQMKLDKFMVYPEEVLGMGSFSAVYMCRDDEGNLAAVKILKKRGKSDNTIIKVAKAEAKIIKKLKHPNIVVYLGSYESLNHYYILFQYCEGKSLRDLCKKNHHLKAKDLIKLITGLLNALKYLHEKKLMHRDLKPENIKISASKITLLDFGFACQLANGERTVLHEPMGTPSYMSPEMLQRKNYTSNSDIWSFGILIYEAAFGKIPWEGRNESELLKNIQRKDLMFPKEVKISENIKNLISRCLNKNSTQRISWANLFEYLLIDWSVVEKEAQNNTCNCSFFEWL